jgi:hypothetical protein
MLPLSCVAETPSGVITESPLAGGYNELLGIIKASNDTHKRSAFLTLCAHVTEDVNLVERLK